MMDKKKLIVLLFLFITMIAASTAYKIARDYAYNRTISEYLDQKENK